MSPIEDNRVCLLGAWNALFSLARLQHGDCALVGEPIFLIVFISLRRSRTFGMATGCSPRHANTSVEIANTSQEKQLSCS